MVSRMTGMGWLLLCSLATAAAPPAWTWPLDASQRRTLDSLALAEPRAALIDEHVNLAGTIPAFFLSRLDLPLEEELNRSKLAHQELLRTTRVLPTPNSVEKLLDRLVNQLPTYQKPDPLRFKLSLLDRDSTEVSTPGGGHLYLDRGLLEQIQRAGVQGESGLAFLLARQLAHIALGHCRRGWQRVVLEEEARKGIEHGIAPSVWRDLLETQVDSTGRFLQFLYSLNQECRADLYAFQLCRNAGFNLDQTLDGMRYVASRPDPAPATQLRRLKRLIQEKEGTTDTPEDFGLFEYDRSQGTFIRCADKSVSAQQRPIIFIHGMWGNSESWLPYLRHWADQKLLEGRPLLVLRHPGNGSLARSGLLLHRQMRRVVADPSGATFVCHSAGGLVFRWYAEQLRGEFDRAVIMATPHAGSNLTQLKYLVDLQEFFGALRLGYADGIARLLAEGRGEISLDLHPDSLFFRALGTSREKANRYDVFYGVMMKPIQAQLLAATFLRLRRTLEPRILPALPDGLTRRQTEKFLSCLVLPAEIISGDGVVAISSGKLAGAKSLTRFALGHLAFRSDPNAIQKVLDLISP
ncbi:MAG: alpha/beta fold hydrolase [Gemmataceae bacterium]